MNYQKIYDQIIERAKTRKLESYKERHHIIPKCIGGTNEKSNIVELTAREHFLCHWLLYEIYLGNRKLAMAFFMMCNIKDRNQKRYTPSSRIYQYAKNVSSLLHHSKLDKYKDIYRQRIIGKSNVTIYGEEKAIEISKKKSKSLLSTYEKDSTLSKRKSLSMKNKNKKSQKLFTCSGCGKIGGISTMKQKHLPICKLLNATNA